MSYAAKLAYDTRSEVHPRPSVGAVIVKNNRLVGAGSTKKKPGPHAEAVAIKEAGSLAKGSTLYCTLEPHCYKSSVSPCTSAIIEAGIKEVVIGAIDENSLVNGKGLRLLNEAGITTTLMDKNREITELYNGYNKWLKTKLPYVTLKSGMSIDGKLSTKSGDSKWITSEGSRNKVHLMRSQSDAIVTSIGTVLADEPSLNIRLPNQPAKKTVVCVFDTDGRLPKSSKLLSNEKVFWFTAEDVLAKFEQENLEQIHLKRTKDGLDIKEGLKILGEKGFLNILVESGAHFNNSMLMNDLVDQLDIFIGTIVIGGDGLSFTVGTGVKSLSSAKKFELLNYSSKNGDMHLSFGKRNV